MEQSVIFVTTCNIANMFEDSLKINLKCLQDIKMDLFKYKVHTHTSVYFLKFASLKCIT